MISLFPMFVKLSGRTCLVIGAGKVGEPKIATLIETGARVRVIALEPSHHVRSWAAAGRIELHTRPFRANDLDGIFLVVAATNSRELNEFAYREATLRGVLCNAVDDPERCDFFYPAVVQRGSLQIAISTAGKSPSFAQHLRKQLESQFGPAYGPWVDELGKARKLVLASDLHRGRKRQLLHSLASHVPVESASAGPQNSNNEGNRI
ncbi:MAG TPA: bifunctional precorrin-2 dehydrogenase/sirohydrochlorin ferrochelatase [Terriglobales bacterium]